MSELSILIQTRRTVEAFDSRPVSPETIIELLETAVWAPNHRLTEPWRFIILTGDTIPRYASIRREMAIATATNAPTLEAKMLAGESAYRKFSAIPLYLAVAMTPNANVEIYNEDYAACAALIQNFLLLAWDRGIGTAWKTFKNTLPMRALLGLADAEIVVGIIHIGYPAPETYVTRRTPARGKVTMIGGG
jgi:nitroreductase